MQVVDPHLFGPLWRFNDDFTELDARGKGWGYKNLPDRLRYRAVGGSCSGGARTTWRPNCRAARSTITSSPMAEEQRLRYDDYHAPAARADRQIAQRRPLTQAGIRPPAAIARLHAHGLRHARISLTRPAGSAPSSTSWKASWPICWPSPTARSSSSPNGSGCWSWCANWPSEMGARVRLAHRLGAAGAAPRGDQRGSSSDPGCRLFLSHRQRQRSG